MVALSHQDTKIFVSAEQRTNDGVGSINYLLRLVSLLVTSPGAGGQILSQGIGKLHV